MPSLFSFTPAQKLTPDRVDRFNRVKRRRLALTPIHENQNPESQSDLDSAAQALLNLGSDLTTHADTGTDPEPDPLSQKVEQLTVENRQLSQECQRLRSENMELKNQLKKDKFTYINLDNSKISTLTGLPSLAVFKWILTFVALHFKSVGKLCAGDMLLLVLMKLRHSLTNKDLAMRFNICPTQVSKILNQCLPTLAKRLKFLIKWPCKNTILKNMPKSFRRSYKKCRVIIDCSEIFIQRPSNLDTRAKTWSNYKHHNTMKFLVGITPYGAVSFLSRCWGGRISDKEITEKSGFYDKLEHGDLVLADRGFLISEELAARGASLAIPPFSKGKAQFSQREVETARKLSRSRIHVERAIERIKKFRILKNTMPVSLMKHSDNILTICAALTNLLPKLVK